MSRNDLAQIETAEAIEDSAAAWLWRRSNTAWREDDQAALDVWLAKSHAHMAAFWRLEAVWDRSQRLKVLQHAQAEREAPLHRRKIWPFFGIAGASGASLAVIVVLTRILWPASGQIYSTAVGGHATIRLADGSRVELNTDTTISAAVTSGKRTITLRNGEAFFQIHHDSARSFEVLAAGYRIVDLGTKFSVRAFDHGLKVSLVEGRARLEPAETGSSQRSVELVPGEVVVATANSIAVSKKTPLQIADDLAWKDGLLVFRHVTLEDAAEEFNRYNTEKLIVIGSSISKLKINGTFASNNVNAFARMAQIAMDLHIEKSDGQIRMTR